NGNCKLLASEIFVSDPCSNHCKILNHVPTINCIFFHRKKLNCTLAFTQCFLSASKTSVNQPKHAQRGAIIWLGLHDLLLLGSCSSESRMCFGIVLRHPSDKTFHKTRTQFYCFLETIFA